MLDVKQIRENPEECKARLAARQKDYGQYIDEVCRLDEERRKILFELESLKARQNTASKEIPRLKKEGLDSTAIFTEMKEIAARTKTLDASLKEVEDGLADQLYSLPNIPSASVPVGADETGNVEVRRAGTVPTFAFTPKAHWEIGEGLDILDPAAAAKVTGARFHFYKGAGAALERAIYCFFLDHHTNKNGYTEVLPPFLVNRASMTGTGQLPKFEDDAFRVDAFDYFLVPTAEVPVTNMHRNEMLDEAVLPIKYTAYSACFRAEAGSAGRDTRGLIRQHQFNKVELVKFAHPDTSYEELELLTADAESVLAALGIPYRVSLLCTGDMGFGSAKTYDIEAWMPSYDRYVEISSCSNYEDFQSRRMAIRFKDSVSGKSRLVHTLNGSGVAVGRTVACILENFQNEDGSVTVPEVLRPYLGGKSKIG